MKPDAQGASSYLPRRTLPMPSTPRMIELERKASTPGEGLSQATLEAAWLRVNGYIKPGDLQGNGCDQTAFRNGLIAACNLIMEMMPGDFAFTPPDYAAATRYLDSPAWKAR